MIIKTRKLPATQSEGERMRATTITGPSATLTIAYPYDSTDPHELVASMLAMAFGHTRVERVLAYNQFQTREWEGSPRES